MSHPDPHFDPENAYPADDYKPVRKESPVEKLKRLVKESEELRKGDFKKQMAKKMKRKK